MDRNVVVSDCAARERFANGSPFAYAEPNASMRSQTLPEDIHVK